MEGRHGVGRRRSKKVVEVKDDGIKSCHVVGEERRRVLVLSVEPASLT